MGQESGEDRDLKDVLAISQQVAGRVINQLDKLPSNKAVLDKGNAVLVFLLELPFQVAVPSLAVTLVGKDENLVSLVFDYYRKSVYQGYQSISTVPMSLVRMITPVTRDAVGNDVSPYFDYCLLLLNEFLRAYAVIARDPDVKDLTLPMLHPMCLFAMYDKTTLEELSRALLQINWAVAYEKEPLEADKIGAIVHLVGARRAGTNPFLLTAELTAQSEALFRTGQYTLSLIVQATRLEVFLNVVLRELLLMEGQGDVEISTTLERPLLSRVKRDYHPRIGGNFSVETAGPLKEWHDRVHKIRSRIVHGAYEASREEALSAGNAGDGIVRFVGKLLVKKDSRFKDYLGID